MSDTAVIYMSNGKTYTVSSSPASLHQALNTNDGSDERFKSFHLVNGKEVLINPVHVVAVETSELSNMDASTSDDTTFESDKNRKEDNLKAAKKFKKDLDGNME